MTALTDAQALGNDSGQKTFTYDANGNLTYDGRQDLEIRWNVLNLVFGAVTHDNGSLTYARLSDGTLFAQQKVSGGSTTGKRYCGSFVFTTGTGITTPLVESIAWDEGRIFRNAQTGAYQDCWFAGDHLGDVRSVVDITQSLYSPVVLEQNDYLPYGTKIANSQHAQMGTNRWRYAGKEEFPELNLLDFGARLYDPFTARWTASDPMATKYSRVSPFGYCAGNPIGILDDSGLDLVIAGKNGSSVTFKTDLIDREFSVASLGLDWKGNYTLEGEDLLSAGLDLVGIIDPTGVADAANAALQFRGGDYWGAGASLLGVIPYVGDLAKAGKIGKDSKIISDAIALSRNSAKKGFKSFEELGIKDGMKASSSEILDYGEQFLGKGYREVSPGRYLSADGRRAVRIGDNDILGYHSGAPHANFETLVPNPLKPGKDKVELNYHIFITE